MRCADEVGPAQLGRVALASAVPTVVAKSARLLIRRGGVHLHHARAGRVRPHVVGQSARLARIRHTSMLPVSVARNMTTSPPVMNIISAMTETDEAQALTTAHVVEEGGNELVSVHVAVANVAKFSDVVKVRQSRTRNLATARLQIVAASTASCATGAGPMPPPLRARCGEGGGFLTRRAAVVRSPPIHHPETAPLIIPTSNSQTADVVTNRSSIEGEVDSVRSVGRGVGAQAHTGGVGGVVRVSVPWVWH